MHALLDLGEYFLKFYFLILINKITKKKKKKEMCKNIINQKCYLTNMTDCLECMNSTLCTLCTNNKFL